MIINRLALENFGPYRGRQEVLLRSDGDAAKPIVLFGGKNGAGKTSLFEAIRLCLYGINALGGRQRRADYERFLIDRIHRNGASPVEANAAAVELEFEYAQLGRLSTYVIRREWERRGAGVVERLEVLKEGQRLDTLEADQWQDFIKELIPLGLSRLFFFDGEKIEELASQGADSEQFRDSFRNLLGLDLIERLQSDLSIQISRQERHADLDAVQRRFQTELEDLHRLEAETERLTRERARAQNEVDRIRSAIEGQESRLAKEGGGFASKRQDLKHRADAVEARISEIEDQVRVMAAGLLPFALTPDYLRALEGRLLEEAEIARIRSAQSWMEERKARARKHLKAPKFWKDFRFGAPTRKELTSRFLNILNEMTPRINGFEEIVHPCSDVDRAKLLSGIRQALDDIPTELAKHSRRLERLHKERREIERFLRQAPEEDVLGPLVQRLNELHKELGVAESRLRQLEEEVRITEFKRGVAERQAKTTESDVKKAQGVSHRIVTAIKVREVLDAYLARLTRVKLEELSATLADMFSRLSNKPGYYTRVDIDPASFSTTLYNRAGDRVTRDQLSAGERQMFATALLWALARTSGRPLPFIIDTPLGRLDHDHRSNLVRTFFPHASHQVIILSTDSEIDSRYYQMLRPHVSRAYTLGYDLELGESQIREGYEFEKEKVGVPV